MDDSFDDQEGVDAKATLERQAIQSLKDNADFMQRLNGEAGAPWGGIKQVLKDGLPETLDDRDSFAYHLVKKTMDELFGDQDGGMGIVPQPVDGQGLGQADQVVSDTPTRDTALNGSATARSVHSRLHISGARSAKRHNTWRLAWASASHRRQLFFEPSPTHICSQTGVRS